MSGSSLSVSLFVLVSGLTALVAFVWAIYHRQLRGSEEAKFTMFDAETTLAAQPRPWNGRIWLMMGAILCIFGFITWSIVLTIVAASHTPAQSQDASPSVASPM